MKTMGMMKRTTVWMTCFILVLSVMGCSKSGSKAETGKTTDAAVQQNGKDAGSEATRVAGSEATEGSGRANSPEAILTKPEVPILCYHRIEDGKTGAYTVSQATFKAHIKALADSGFHSVSPDQLYNWLVYNKPLPSKPVMITFDDSRSEHAGIAAPTLEKYGFRGVFFIMTITYGKKNYMTTDQIAALAKAGHTVGLHTWDHTMATKFKDSTDWRKQIADPARKLAGFTGLPVSYFAYPNGVWNHDAAKQLAQYFRISFTLISKRDSAYPLQTVRRMLATEGTPQGLIRSMRRTFKLKD